MKKTVRSRIIYNENFTFDKVDCKNIVVLYNKYYELYKENVENDEKFIIMNYCELVGKNGYEYFQTTLSKFNISIKKKDFDKVMSRPSKNHGKSVPNNKIADEKCKNFKKLLSEEEMDFIKKNVSE